MDCTQDLVSVLSRSMQILSCIIITDTEKKPLTQYTLNETESCAIGGSLDSHRKIT